MEPKIVSDRGRDFHAPILANGCHRKTSALRGKGHAPQCRSLQHVSDVPDKEARRSGRGLAEWGCPWVLPHMFLPRHCRPQGGGGGKDLVVKVLMRKVAALVAGAAVGLCLPTAKAWGFPPHTPTW